MATITAVKSSLQERIKLERFLKNHIKLECLPLLLTSTLLYHMLARLGAYHRVESCVRLLSRRLQPCLKNFECVGGKHSSLLRYDYYYGHKKFYGTGSEIFLLFPENDQYQQQIFEKKSDQARVFATATHFYLIVLYSGKVRSLP
jgi:hypothetical protein